MDATGQDPSLPLADPGKPAAAPPSLPRRLWRLMPWRPALLVAALFAGAVAGLYYQPSFLRAAFDLTGLQPGGGTARPFALPAARAARIATPDAEPETVAALGRLMPEGRAVALAPPGGAGTARLARLLVREGERVAAGQVIAELDTLPMLLAQQANAEAALAAQAATGDQVRATILANLADARAAHARAGAAELLAQQDLDRVVQLAARDAGTQMRVQQAQAAATQAIAELARSKAMIARYDGAEEGRQSDMVLAARNLDMARAALARAAQDVTTARVVAPRAGTILAIHARAGERPGDAGVVTLGDVERMMAELEVYQTDISRVAPGQKVTLTAPALAAPLEGSVTTVGLMVERQSVMATEPAANADARIVRVTVTLDAAASTRARGLTNLEVLGRIRVGAP